MIDIMTAVRRHQIARAEGLVIVSELTTINIHIPVNVGSRSGIHKYFNSAQQPRTPFVLNKPAADRSPVLTGSYAPDFIPSHTLAPMTNSPEGLRANPFASCSSIEASHDISSLPLVVGGEMSLRFY